MLNLKIDKRDQYKNLALKENDRKVKTKYHIKIIKSDPYFDHRKSCDFCKYTTYWFTKFSDMVDDLQFWDTRVKLKYKLWSTNKTKNSLFGKIDYALSDQFFIPEGSIGILSTGAYTSSLFREFDKEFPVRFEMFKEGKVPKFNDQFTMGVPHSHLDFADTSEEENLIKKMNEERDKLRNLNISFFDVNAKVLFEKKV